MFSLGHVGKTVVTAIVHVVDEFGLILSVGFGVYEKNGRVKLRSSAVNIVDDRRNGRS